MRIAVLALVALCLGAAADPVVNGTDSTAAPLAESKPEAAPGIVEKPEVVTEPKPEAVTEPKPEAVTEPKPEAVTEPTVTEPKPEAVTEPKPEADAAVEVKPKADAAVEVKAETTVAPQAEVATEPTVEVAAESKVAATTEPKAEAAEPKTEAVTAPETAVPKVQETADKPAAKAEEPEAEDGESKAETVESSPKDVPGEAMEPTASYEGLVADCPWNDLVFHRDATLEECKAFCDKERLCVGFTFSTADHRLGRSGCITKTRKCRQPLGKCSGKWCFYGKVGVDKFDSDLEFPFKTSTNLSLPETVDVFDSPTHAAPVVIPNGRRRQFLGRRGPLLPISDRSQTLVDQMLTPMICICVVGWILVALLCCRGFCRTSLLKEHLAAPAWAPRWRGNPTDVELARNQGRAIV